MALRYMPASQQQGKRHWSAFCKGWMLPNTGKSLKKINSNVQLRWQVSFPQLWSKGYSQDNTRVTSGRLSDCPWVAQAFTPQNICGTISRWHFRFFPSNLMELERICQEDLYKLPKYRCAKLVETYPMRLKSIFAGNWAFTKYWIKVLNNFVNYIIKFMIINKFVKKGRKKHVFTLCHYGLLSVNWFTIICEIQ